MHGLKYYLHFILIFKNKLMQLLENIKSSIYNPAYYSEILNKPFSYSLRYFLSLMVLFAVIATIVFSFSILPKVNKFVNEGVPKILNYYPDNLEVAVKAGKVSTNVPEPYFIKLPAEFKDGNQGTGTRPAAKDMENLLVIDTKTPITIDLFNSYKTAAVLGYDSFAYDDNGAIKIQSLDQSLNGVVTKAKFSDMLNKVMPYLKILSFVLLPIVFIFSFMGFALGYLLYLIFGALVIWIMAKVMKKDLGYGKSYQLGLHAITLGVILEATVFLFYPNLGISFLFTFLMLMIFWVNLKPAASEVVPKPEDK